MTHTLVSVSAPPIQRETPVTGVRPATGVTTPQQAARYTHTHTLTHANINTHTLTHRRKHTHIHALLDTLTFWCLFSHVAVAPQEAPPLNVIRPMVSVNAKKGLRVGHVTSVPGGTTATQHARRAAATSQEQMRPSATKPCVCVTVDSPESVCARSVSVCVRVCLYLLDMFLTECVCAADRRVRPAL